MTFPDSHHHCESMHSILMNAAGKLHDPDFFIAPLHEPRFQFLAFRPDISVPVGQRGLTHFHGTRIIVIIITKMRGLDFSPVETPDSGVDPAHRHISHGLFSFASYPVENPPENCSSLCAARSWMLKLSRRCRQDSSQIGVGKA
jgi:hypothetical protein